MNKKKGIFLIYVLFTAVLISVFLITAVKDMHHNFFMSRKFAGEHKAYWAAEAGIQYCEYKLKSDLGWPFLNVITSDNNSTGKETFGKFTVTSSLHDGGKGYYVHGKSNEDDEEFCIYFSKRNTNKIIDGEEITSLIPTIFPSEPQNLSYCSYSSMTKEIAEKIYAQAQEENPVETEYNEENFIISNNPTTQRAVITSPGIYIVSDGRCGIYRTVLEKMLIANYGNKLDGGIYSSGNINVHLAGKDSLFQISQTDNSKPEIYCRRGFKVNRVKDDSVKIDEENTNYNFPCDIENGTLYFKSSFDIKDDITNNKYSINKVTSYKQFKRKYGINVDKYNNSTDTTFPKLNWDKILEMKEIETKKHEAINNKTNDKELPKINSGTYVTVYEQDTDSYSLFRLNKNYMERNGKLKSTEFEQDIDNIKPKVIEQLKNEKNKKLTDRDVIQAFIRELNNSNNLNSLSKNNNEDDNFICSQKEGENNNEIFAINTITVGNKKNPLVKLKKSVETSPNGTISTDDNEYFNLITIKKTSPKDNIDITDEETIKKIKFTLDNNTYTNLLLNEYNNVESSTNQEKKENNSLISKSNGSMLFSNGYIAINGKIFGTGQILSGGSIYFKTGSQINTTDSEDEDENEEDESHQEDDEILDTKNEESIEENQDIEFTNNSTIAIYSKGTVQIGMPRGKRKTNELKKQIANKLANHSASSETAIAKEVLKLPVTINADNKKNWQKELNISVKTQQISLQELMKKYYGFSSKEARLYLEEIISKNVTVKTVTNKLTKTTSYIYKMPEADKISIRSKSSSNFKGVIYCCGGFKCDAEYNDLVINGILVTYGGDPNYTPGLGTNLNNKDLLGIEDGSIKIENCSNFSVIYNSEDMSNFTELCYGETPINLTSVYFNKLQ